MSCPVTPLAVETGNVVNPYVSGLLGNWRPKNSYAYLEDRLYGQSVDLKDDGEYVTFDSFWTKGLANSIFTKNETSSNFSKWTTATTATKIDEYGNSLESKDALGVYSSAVYNNQGNLIIAAGNNAQYGQLAFDGFENYEGRLLKMCPENEYFGNSEDIPDNHSLSSQSHTGEKSLIIVSQDVLTYTVNLNTNVIQPQPNDMPYTMKEIDALFGFGNYESDVAQDYLVSYWVKENSNLVLNDFNGISLSSNNITIQTGVSKSKVIEGWQKIDQIITIPAGVNTNTTLSFNNTSLNNYLIDDIRIQPVKSSMKSFVYDYKTLRFIAELDENNFATFYEYDEEGALLRVKKETVRGIQTIQESRNHSSK